MAGVTGQSCRAYAAERGSQSAARRELEDLRSAIRYHRMEGLCREVVEVTLPEKSQSRLRWLTRDEVAHLVWTAWRKAETQRGRTTKRHPWRHVARFILLAVYTGTRAGSVCAASFSAEPGTSWVDLERGVFYRRPQGAAETRKRRPPVPLPPQLLAHLRRWHRRGHRRPVAFNGDAVRDVDKAFRAVARAAGLPDVTPHTLRHTAATWLMQAGVDLWEAAGYLGMTVEILESVYGHHHPDHLRGAVDAMGRSGRKPVEKNSGTKTDSAAISLEKKARKLRN